MEMRRVLECVPEYARQARETPMESEEQRGRNSLGGAMFSACSARISSFCAALGVGSSNKSSTTTVSTASLHRSRVILSSSTNPHPCGAVPEKSTRDPDVHMRALHFSSAHTPASRVTEFRGQEDNGAPRTWRKRIFRSAYPQGCDGLGKNKEPPLRWCSYKLYAPAQGQPAHYPVVWKSSPYLGMDASEEQSASYQGFQIQINGHDAGSQFGVMFSQKICVIVLRPN
ncbi:hypothetical protein B0H14DRAFT_3761844 [Mycena olivaceomarginata]|nr:hypothetical protein B0H14DRAFT_3761844 [Mycena olivaceomarginata]